MSGVGRGAIAQYASAWKARAVALEKRRLERAARARLAAKAAARQLVNEYGATEVWLFGSLARSPAHEAFDIDLAVRGLAPENYFRALDLAITVAGFPVDIVSLETCPHSLGDRVTKEGIRLA